MAKKEIDRHVDVPQVSFTLLVDVPDLKQARALAKAKDRTTGSILREALRLLLKNGGLK